MKSQHYLNVSARICMPTILDVLQSTFKVALSVPVSQLPKINRTCAASIINTLIWCPSCSRSHARLHSALCRARPEALNLALSTINYPRAQASFDFILLWLTGINTLSFVRPSTSTSPYRHVCCVCGGSPTGRSAGDSAWRDAGLLWYCWRCLQDPALIADGVWCAH